MADAEKVVNAWETFRKSNPYEICSGREFQAGENPGYRMGQMVEDTIELLKKQIPMRVIIKPSKGDFCIVALCPSCKVPIYHWSKPSYCNECGQAVKWE